MAEEYLSQDPNAGLEDQYLSTDPNAGLAVSERPQQSGFQQALGTAQQAIGVGQQVLMGALEGPGIALHKLAFPVEAKLVESPLIPTKVIEPVVHALQAPQRSLLETAFGDTGKAFSEASGQFLTEQLAGFTSPESLALLAVPGAVAKMPKLREIAFGKPPPVPEAMPQTPEVLPAEVAAQETQPTIQQQIGGEINAEQIQGATRPDVNVQLPVREAAREVGGGEMPTNVGGEGVPEGGQGETLQQTPEVTPKLAPVPENMVNAVRTPKGNIVGIGVEHGDVISKLSEKYDPTELESGWVLPGKTKAETDATFISTNDVQKFNGDFQAAFDEKLKPPVPQPEQPASAMSISEFEDAARRGKINQATGEVTEAEKSLSRDARPFESGKAAGYSIDDIAHFYKNFPGLEPKEAYEYFKADAKTYESKQPTPVSEGGSGLPQVGQPKAEWETTTAQPLPQTEVPPPPVPTGGDNPQVSRIANRYVDERVASGEIGEIAPGEGYSTQELAAAGLKMPPEEINQHISDLVNKTGDPIKQAQAVRAEESRLSQLSTQASKLAEANPNDANLQAEADNAFKNLTDFHNGPVAQAKENFHALGMSMQGELPVDLSTFNGLREQWLKDVGKPPTPEQDAIIKKQAAKVAATLSEDSVSRANLRDAIDKATSRRKLPTPEEVQNNIMERMKVEPCLT